MIEKFTRDYVNRSGTTKIFESVLGTVVLLAGIAGALFLDVSEILSSVMIGVGALFVSKTKTLEALDVIKDNLPWSK